VEKLRDYGNKLTFTFIDNKCKLYEMNHSHTKDFVLSGVSAILYGKDQVSTSFCGRKSCFSKIQVKISFEKKFFRFFSAKLVEKFLFLR